MLLVLDVSERLQFPSGKLSLLGPSAAEEGPVQVQCVAILNQDSFYRELTEEEHLKVQGADLQSHTDLHVAPSSAL